MSFLSLFTCHLFYLVYWYMLYNCHESSSMPPSWMNATSLCFTLPIHPSIYMWTVHPCSISLLPIHTLPMHVNCPVMFHRSAHTSNTYPCSIDQYTCCLLLPLSTCIHVVQHCFVPYRCCPILYIHPPSICTFMCPFIYQYAWDS